MMFCGTVFYSQEAATGKAQLLMAEGRVCGGIKSESPSHNTILDELGILRAGSHLGHKLSNVSVYAGTILVSNARIME